MEEAELQNTSILSLPNELLLLILQNNNYHDIVAFGSTCKRFWQMIENNQSLWKDKFKSIIPTEMFDTVDKHCNGDWLNAIKSFFNLKKFIISAILAMSPKFYLKCSELTLDDVRIFFTIALSDNMNYYYVIFILQDLIKKGNAQIDKNTSEKPFTMTEMYYAKEALRYLVQSFLAAKWDNAYHRLALTPEKVVNFFLQWMDTANLYSDTEIDKSINDLVTKVKVILNTQNPKLDSKSKQGSTNKPVSERQVLIAVGQVVYHDGHMAVITAANLDSLNIVKALKLKFSNIIVVAAIYQAVARHCGVECEMIAYETQMHLEWMDKHDPAGPCRYTVDLYSGELDKQKLASWVPKYKYCPYLLLQYIYSCFEKTMGAIKNWNTQNANNLEDFLEISNCYLTPFRTFNRYLGCQAPPEISIIPLDLTYLNDAYMEIIRVMVNLNVSYDPPVTQSFIVKRHASRVKYAVGMICYHKKFDYVGIIRAWDESCDVKWAQRMEMELNLESRTDQPFYYVVAADQSARYVAQENLVEVTHPNRLYDLEDILAREFTHFNGFSYVPNDEKRTEYPDEEPIADMYRSRSHYKQ